ncbi:MAG: EamA/RhaT family transporter, partial [Mesorhizobium sp.]
MSLWINRLVLLAGLNRITAVPYKTPHRARGSLSKMRSIKRFIPASFVVLWATGFIGARYAMPW